MKIRTDFVTNSSSSSFVSIHIDNPLLRQLLDKYSLGKYVDFAYHYDNMSERVMNSFPEDTVDVIDFLIACLLEINGDDEDAGKFIREVNDREIEVNWGFNRVSLEISDEPEGGNGKSTHERFDYQFGAFEERRGTAIKGSEKEYLSVLTKLILKNVSFNDIMEIIARNIERLSGASAAKAREQYDFMRSLGECIGEIEFDQKRFARGKIPGIGSYYIDVILNGIHTKKDGDIDYYVLPMLYDSKTANRMLEEIKQCQQEGKNITVITDYDLLKALMNKGFDAGIYGLNSEALKTTIQIDDTLDLLAWFSVILFPSDPYDPHEPIILQSL